MAENGNKSAIWSGWILWTLVCTLGFAIGIGLSLFVNQVVGEVLSFLALGAAVGFAQWLVLRKTFQGSGWWILATALGAGLGLAGTNFIHRFLLGTGGYLVVGGAGFAALGLVVGLAQWWVLRIHLKRAGWWVLISAVGWFVGGLAAWGIGLRLIEFAKIIADYAILGTIVGASTGAALLLLIKEPALLENRRTSPIMTWAIASCSLLLIIVIGVRDQTGSTSDNLIPIPDLSSVPNCPSLPSRDCEEGDSACSELIFFEPVEGPGYINYPVNDETWNDQYRSYLRRDLLMSIQYASARVACETDDWDYWPFEPIGLGDMSEADGAIPGTSKGHPQHPPGTHEDGNDIDVAYFQRESINIGPGLESRLRGLEDNLLRSMCKHTRFGMDALHCTEPSQSLDPWRTALFIAYVAENPYTRVIGVDGQIGPVLDHALDQLEESGWISSDLREEISLAYESVDEGTGWFRFHHHHLHISMYLR